MASPSKDDALKGFQRLSPNVWLLERGESSHINSAAEPANGGVQSPSTIVLLTWMNASPRNTARYIKGYTKLYPTARILLVTNTNIDIQFRSDAKQQKRI
ncbi:MAG: hypothetical protein M1835_006822, partial [Candelina submexicana]